MQRKKIELVQNEHGDWTVNVYKSVGECANGEIAFERKRGYHGYPGSQALIIVADELEQS